ncbi:MAG: phosphate ABC transporter permease subunit PstC [Bdellovibrionaceae bacterium]|nr:phosphate ABC transporter permease subunit PstC [Pseudobdellovibrionaceae bacterium]
MANRKSIKNTPDLVFYFSHKFFSLLLVSLFLLMFVCIGYMSKQAFQEIGLDLFTGLKWIPAQKMYGMLPVIYGTIVSSIVALLIAVPMSLCIALYLVEISHHRVGSVISFFVEMLAAIPSIVFGMWGLFVLVPFMRSWVQPALLGTMGWLPFFQGPPFGMGLLTAGIILAIMIMPTITSVCIEVFKTISQIQKESALGLGATRWEMIRLSVLKASVSGITGASVLGLGRAFGETMAVTMVVGNVARISASLFEPSQTMASLLANQYAEADGDLHLSALTAVGFVLFIIALIINFFARVIVLRSRGRNG